MIKQTKKEGLPLLIHVQGIGTIVAYFAPFLIVPMLILNIFSILHSLVNHQAMQKKYFFQILFLLTTVIFLLAHTTTQTKNVF